LVQPTEPGNIGAAARAIKNMGFRHLELVKPVPYKTREAKGMACGARDILDKAAIHPTIGAAIAGKSLVVGATRRLGSRRGIIRPLRLAAGTIAKTAVRNPVAVLFGNEHNGLTNDQVDECGFLITIPANPAFPSLNLAQSVMMVAYELSQVKPAAEVPELVENREVQKLLKRIKVTLALLEYRPKGDRNLETEILRNVKRLLGRAGLTEWELNMLYGLCRQVSKRLSQGR
jgi:TrmH family RNA methyltransferase